MAKADLKTYNPFPGLRPFREDEVHLFFGRKSRVNTMVDKLAQTHFLAVVGASGSGKSSLVNCGLLPALHQGRMAEAGTAWRKAHFRPEDDPIGKLARALAGKGAVDDNPASEGPGASSRKGGLFSGTDTGRIPLEMVLETTLRRSKLGLVEAYQKARLPEHVNLLVVVDQFEELFRYAGVGDASNGSTYSVTDDATAFVNLLLEAQAQALEAGYPIYVVITMRSDYLGDCARFAGLPEMINESQYLVPRMTRGERRDAVKGPIAVGGVQIGQSAKMAAPLLTRLVNDVGDNPDQLSIMQHALNRTWDHWLRERNGEGTLGLAHYDHIGTMARALDKHAERAFAELKTGRQQFICEKIFKTLTDKGTDPRGVRRPTRLGKLCVVAGAGQDEVEAVMKVFRKPSRSFLMPPEPEALHAETVIDISHESLMRVWKRLKQWVDEEAESAQVYRHLAVRAVLYEQGKESLLHDPQLQRVLDWRDETRPNQAWAQRYHPEYALAMHFLDKSERRRRVWMLLKVVAGVLVLAVILTAFYAVSTAGHNRELEGLNQELQEAFQTAKDSAEAAQEQRDRANANATRADSLKNVALDNANLAERRRQVAEIQRQFAVNARDSTQNLLKEVATLNEQLTGALGEAQESERVAQEQRALAENLQQQATQARQVTVGLALASRAVSQMASGEAELGALLAREAYLFNQRNGGSFQNEVYDALRKTLNALEDGSAGPEDINVAHRDEVRSVAYSPDGRWMASAGADGHVYLSAANTASGPSVLEGHVGLVRSVAFSPEGSTLASAGDDGVVRVWDVVSGTQRYTMSGDEDVRAVVFSPGGSMLATAGADGTVRLWNADGSNPRSMTDRHAGSAQAVAFSPDGRTVASGGVDGTVRLWNANTGESLRVMRGHQGAVQTVTFGPGGRLISAGADGTVRVWDPAAGVQQNVLSGHGGPVNAVAFSPDQSQGALLASASGDQSVRLWNLDRPNDSPVILQEGGSWVRSIAFSPDGAMLVAGSRDRKVRRWNIDAAALAGAICDTATRPLTDEEWKRYVGSDIPYPYDGADRPCPAASR